MGAIAWMQKGPFGIMVHFIKETMPKEGEVLTDWNKIIDRFDVKRLCDDIVSTGAKWLIFTFGQNNGYYCSPNAELERLIPGRCSRRDLMRELCENLTARDIRVIAYLPSEVDGQKEEMRAALGWDLDPVDKSVFQERYRKIIGAWSVSLGKLLSGWWFDGCYNAQDKPFLRTREWSNRRFDINEWLASVKAGNPESVVAMNTGANNFELLFPYLDYLAGETNDLKTVPQGPLYNGAQWQALTYLDCLWGHVKVVGPIKPPRFSDEELFAWILACHIRGGAVTLNIGIYQDSTLAEATLAQVRRLGQRMKEILTIRKEEINET